MRRSPWTDRPPLPCAVSCHAPAGEPCCRAAADCMMRIRRHVDTDHPPAATQAWKGRGITMSMDAPDKDRLADLADRYGLGLNAADVAAFAPFVEANLGSWAAVEQLYATIAPTPPARDWARPTAEDNPLGAWYVRTDIAGSPAPTAARSATSPHTAWSPTRVRSPSS